MRRFAELFRELDETTRSSRKVQALEAYFRDADPGSAAWALHILLGRRVIRALPASRLRDWMAVEADLPAWMVDECYQAVGDLSETLSLLAPGGPGTPLTLREVVEQVLLPLPDAPIEEQRRRVTDCWRSFTRIECFLLHKLVSGTFRVGAAASLVLQAVANVAGVPKAVMAHRLMSHWRPTGEFVQRVLAGDAEHDPARPYPFLLAHPLLTSPEGLEGSPEEWLVEWKWDGIRAQLIHRQNAVILWSRGEEIINDAFPDLVQAARSLPEGVVLDGEILAWEHDRPRPFRSLQRRINRKRVEPALWPEVPVIFMAFDLPEQNGQDQREKSLRERRDSLERLAAGHFPGRPLQISPAHVTRDWRELDSQRQAARANGSEGLMLKRLDSPYAAGRPRGLWWKWKSDPFTIDAVLMYAQYGSGRRAGLFTDYTFGVLDGDRLVTVAKAYSGLTDAEIAEVHAFIRENTTGRSGPVRLVKPELVFELAFDAVQPSTRHKSGVALRFPRINRWRRDKRPQDADTLEAVKRFMDAER